MPTSKSWNLCSSRAFEIASVILAILVTVTQVGLSETQGGDPGIHFPASDSLPWDKFGLFIGIDKYPNLPGHDLHGCLNDAMSMKETFVRLGVERFVLLTDAQATRAGIGRAMSELVDQVRIAKTKTSEPITVVITYAGHGCRVKRLSSEDDPSSLDDTWVASDSDYPGTRDIRGFELLKFHEQLARLGAQVIIISDSCHSGHAYRSVGAPRTIPGDRSFFSKRLGPSDDLFPQFPLVRSDSLSAGASNSGEVPLPGFVFFSACGDNQVDDEAVDEHGNPCGPLSLVIRHLLSNINDNTTYQELAGKIAAQFAAEYSNQTPEFHCGAGKADELFLHGGFPPAHADIVLGSMQGGTARLTMGSLQGVALGSRFTFFGNLDDLSRRRNAIGSAEADDVDLLTCHIRFNGDNPPPPVTARALLSAVSMSDFVVGVEGDVPGFIIAKLRELDAGKQLQFSSDPQKYSAVVRYDSAAKTINIYSPTALPPADGSQANVPTLRPPILCMGPQDADLVAQNLLYAARVQRLMTLAHEDTGLLTSQLITFRSGDHTASGIPRFRENDRFSVRLTNPTDDTSLYMTLFMLDRNGDLQILYPPAGSDVRPLEPGKSHEFKLDATIDDPAALKPGEDELTLMKVFVTNQPIDFSPLVVPPQTGAKNVHHISRGVGQDSSVFDLVRDVLHGGDLTRPSFRGGALVTSEQWATSDLIFSVEAASAK